MLICPNLLKQLKFVSGDICIQIRIENIFESDFVTCIGIILFKIARNHPKRYHLCQKPAKRCFGNCLLVAPSDGYLCIHNRSACERDREGDILYDAQKMIPSSSESGSGSNDDKP